jgi:hypothetical protein
MLEVIDVESVLILSEPNSSSSASYPASMGASYVVSVPFSAGVGEVPDFVLPATGSGGSDGPAEWDNSSNVGFGCAIAFDYTFNSKSEMGFLTRDILNGG